MRLLRFSFLGMAIGLTFATVVHFALDTNAKWYLLAACLLSAILAVIGFIREAAA